MPFPPVRNRDKTLFKAPSKAFQAAELVPTPPGGLENMQALRAVLSMPELACAYLRERVAFNYWASGIDVLGSSREATSSGAATKSGRQRSTRACP